MACNDCCRWVRLLHLDQGQLREGKVRHSRSIGARQSLVSIRRRDKRAGKPTVTDVLSARGLEAVDNDYDDRVLPDRTI
jgi:hypothetical protein